MTQKEQYLELLKEIKLVRADNIEIKMGLMGSEQLGIKGIVQRVGENEEFITSLKGKDIVKKIDCHDEYIEKDKARNYKAMGIIAACGVFLTALVKFWDKIFK